MPINSRPIRIVWDDDPEAPLAVYSMDPDEITLCRPKWARASKETRRAAIYHELGHHDTGTCYFYTDDGAHEIDIAWLEAKAERAGLERRISDAEWSAAIAEGWTTPAELAEALGVPVPVVEARLRVWRRHSA